MEKISLEFKEERQLTFKSQRSTFFLKQVFYICSRKKEEEGEADEEDDGKKMNVEEKRSGGKIEIRGI